MKKILLTIIFLLFSCIYIFAADQICDEDFEGVTAGCVPEMNPTGSGEISRAARTFHNDCSSCIGGSGSGCDAGKYGAFLATGGNPDKCARADVGPSVGGDSYTEPKWRFDNSIGGGKTIYLKFDLRQDANLDGEYTDLKFIRITSHTDAGAASSSYWHPQLQIQPSSSGCSWYTWSQGGCYGEYYFARATTKTANSLEDNAWHTYEIFIDIGSHVATSRDDVDCDGIVRLWEDEVLILEDEAVPMRCSSDEGQNINSMAFIRHIFGLSGQGYLYFDNIEVWDDMPNGDTTAPVISNQLPSGEQACSSNPRTINISISTDEIATCKYDDEDVAYDSMDGGVFGDGTFAGADSTSHTETTAALACNDSYTIYCRCQDDEPTPNQNSSSAEINFSIDDEYNTVTIDGGGCIISVGGDSTLTIH